MRRSMEGAGNAMTLPAVIASSHATWCGAFVPVTKVDASFCQIVRRQFQGYAVACSNADSMLSHFPGSVGDHLYIIAKRYFERGVWQHLVHYAFHFY